MTDLRQRLGELDQLDAPDMRASIDRRAAELGQTAPQSLVGTSASGWRGPLIAVGTAFVILIVVAGSLLLIGRDDSSVVVEEPTTTVVSTTLPPTTVPSTTVPPGTVPSTTVPAEAVVPFLPSELAVLEVPLSEAVPGFSDTIVWTAVVESSDNVFQAVFRLRPSESTAELLLPSEDDLALGDDVPYFGDALDSSANWLAHVSPFDDHRVTVDSVPTAPGEPSRRDFVGNATQGAAVWHDTEPGHLAWLECPNSSFDSLDGPTTLFTVDVSDPSADPIQVRSFDQGCRTGCWEVGEPCVTLAGWGSTGVWATNQSESVLIDADGAEIATVSDAQMIAMSPDGTSVWRSDNSRGPSFALSPDGQQRTTLPGLDDGLYLFGAWWSADGTRLAMRLGTGLRTVDTVSGEVITEIPGPALDPWGGSVAWSTDSRFLVYESFEGSPIGPETGVLVIHDTATNTTTKISHSGDVSDIRVR